ncbi:hypothetical protein BG011_009384 [Mortierella polycephala]|uniref:F-box domain-containing protein n=1 Tax=Mortierella polycephala TaxID=41804 RepID=A0A9P6PLC1_9FUNG|nr:hypothetical protein BG011_009384 [Mortierella polycephala]
MHPSPSSPIHNVLLLPELLAHIALFLDSTRSDLLAAALVCKAWSTVFSARLWHTLDMPPLTHDCFMDALKQQGHHVRSLKYLGAFDLDAVFSSCPQLTYLDLTLARSLNLLSLRRMVESLPRLQIVRLNCCYSQGIAWLRILQDLRCLNVLELVNDTPEHIIDSIVYAPSGDGNLVEDDNNTEIGSNDDQQESSIDEQEEHEDSANDQGSEPDFEWTAVVQDASDAEEEEANKIDYLGSFLLATASTLTSLGLENTDLVGLRLFRNIDSPLGANESTPSSSGTSTQDQLPWPTLALKKLRLAEVGVQRTNLVVEPLLRSCPNLQALDLSGNIDRPWDRFQWSILSQHCQQLTTLDLSQLSCIDNDQLIRAIRLCPGMCTLRAPQSNLASKVLDAIVDVSVSNKYRPPFQELDICWCTNISQVALTRVLQYVPGLKSLKFSWCQQVDLSIFKKEWTCRDLRVLEAQGLGSNGQEESEADDGDEEHDVESLYMFDRLAQFRSLRRLAMGSDEVVMRNANGFNQLCSAGLTQLQHLDLVGSDIFPLTPAEVESMASGFPRLAHLRFSLGLVDASMQTLLAGARPDIKQRERQVYF